MCCAVYDMLRTVARELLDTPWTAAQTGSLSIGDVFRSERAVPSCSSGTWSNPAISWSTASRRSAPRRRHEFGARPDPSRFLD